MKVLYYDCFCGISGDMNLAALLDLGVPKEYLLQELSKLKLDSEYEIKIEKAEKLGITGTRVDVIFKNKLANKAEQVKAELTTHRHEHMHYDSYCDDHHHEDSHNNVDSYDNRNHHNKIDEMESKHNHIHEGGYSHKSEHKHTHSHDDNRNLKDIEDIIEASHLSNNVKKMSMDMFMKIAEAEAKVHGKSLYEVHFHEVGAIDSIIDMVGAAICIDYLSVGKIIASPVQVGGGFVKCAHGMMPVPAPATVEILKSIPINTGIVQFETTTPTGAAILATNVQEFTGKVDFSIKKIAYGIGHRDLEIPNVLRVYLGETESVENVEEQYIVETNIDDMNPELYGYVEERLFDAGALDVFKTPIFMKKGRPGIKLSVLMNDEIEMKILDIIFEETTSIGVRKYKVEKIMLNREFSKVKTRYGEVTIKKSYYKRKLVKYKPEYEECRTIAIKSDIPIQLVYKEVHKEAINIYDEDIHN